MDLFSLKGNGAEIARIFAQAGADIGIIGRDEKGLHLTRKTVESFKR